MSARSGPLLELRGVHVHHSRGMTAPVRAVDGVDLTVRRGEILALAGESGCGKTTLARAILGLERLAGGQVLLDGVPLGPGRRELKAWRRRIQLVPQDPSGSLNPRRTVLQSVAEGLRIHRLPGDTRDRVSAALERTGLRPAHRFLDRYPGELSGGERQRVLIAGALVLEPEVLIADEPVSSLDAPVRGAILSLLLRLRAELGLTVLVVTHDLGLAWNIADRLAVMYLGRLVEVGPVEGVLNGPRHPYSQALLSVIPQARSVTPIVLGGEPPDPARIPGGCRFAPRCPALATGTADPVAQICRSQSPAVLAGDGGHQSACWLPTRSALR